MEGEGIALPFLVLNATKQEGVPPWEFPSSCGRRNIQKGVRNPQMKLLVFEGASYIMSRMYNFYILHVHVLPEGMKKVPSGTWHSRVVVHMVL